jgi:hypothetical protein
MWLLLLSCDLPLAPADDSGSSGCPLASEGSVPSDFQSLAGYSADDVSAWLVRASQPELTYAATGKSTFTDLTSQTVGDPTLRDYQGFCGDVLALPGSLQITTYDGAFSESIAGEFDTVTVDAAGFSAQLTSLNGSFDWQAVAPKASGVQIDARFTPGDTTGTISAYTVDATGQATLSTLATWVDEL